MDFPHNNRIELTSPIVTVFAFAKTRANGRLAAQAGVIGDMKLPDILFRYKELYTKPGILSPVSYDDRRGYALCGWPGAHRTKYRRFTG